MQYCFVSKICSNGILIATLFVLLSCENTDTPSYIGYNDSDLRINQNRNVPAGPILFISAKVDKDYRPISTLQLYSMNEDGSNVRQITNDTTFPISDAKWSPDGTKIAITGPGGIYIMSSDGSKKYLLTKPFLDTMDYTYGPAGRPVWSPDGKQLAYNRMFLPEFFGKFDIFMINADGTQERWLTKVFDMTHRITDWSRDGSTLMGYIPAIADSAGIGIANTRIAFYDLNGNVLRTIGKLGETFLYPVYSTIGDKIAYQSGKNRRYSAIYIMDETGNEDEILTDDSYLFNRPVSWSPDDTRILYNASYNTRNLGIRSRMLIINISSKVVKDVTPFNTDSTYSYAVSWRKTSFRR